MANKTRTQAAALNGAGPSPAAEPPEQLHTRIPRELRDALRASARRQGVSIAKVVEQSLAAGLHVLHDGDVPAGMPSPLAVLHPSCFFGNFHIQMECDSTGSVNKLTIDSRSSAARKPDPGTDGRGQAQPEEDEHD